MMNADDTTRNKIHVGVSAIFIVHRSSQWENLISYIVSVIWLFEYFSFAWRIKSILNIHCAPCAYEAAERFCHITVQVYMH